MQQLSARPIRVGVIGLNWGRGRCAAIKQIDDARLVAVASRTTATAERVGRELGVDWYTDYRALLDRPDIDLVAVYTPSAQHQTIALDAARAGKHLLITKPLETTLDRIDPLLAAADRAGVKVGTEYMSRYLSANYAAYRAVADGLLGAPVLGEFSYKCYRPMSYYTGTRGTWTMDGGGAIMMQAIHVVDLMLWYLGPVRSVTAHWGTFTHEMEAEDTAVAVVQFSSGALATLVGTTSFHNDRPPGQYGGGTVMRMEVGGARGSVIVADAKVAMWRSELAADPPSSPPPALNAFQDMARWINDDAYVSPTLAAGSEGRQAVEFIQALYASARSGQTVTLPPPG